MGAAVVERKRQEVPETADVVAAVRAILCVSDDELDYAEAKLAFDALVDPSLDVEWAEAELDRLANMAVQMAGPDADEGPRLGAIRQLIYDEGPWNAARPFCYNPAHPEGTHLPDKLLANYLRTRLGNCVSMPILMAILAERLGVDLRLASAPCHIFVRYVAPDGTPINIEATSGGHPARLEWFRKTFAISDRAIESGLYMRTLSRRESIALMATTVLEHLLARRDHRGAIAVAETILAINPHDGQTMMQAASAYSWLIQAEFAAVYPSSFLIPVPLRPRYRFLCARGEDWFARAEALGWTPDPELPPPSAAASPSPRQGTGRGEVAHQGQ